MRPWSFASWLALRCPACQADSFKAGFYKTARRCAACGQVFERESGFFAGAIYPFYGASAVLGAFATLGGILILGWSFQQSLWLAGGAVLLASPWLFWYARLAFLHTDHRFFREDR